MCLRCLKCSEATRNLPAFDLQMQLAVTPAIKINRHADGFGLYCTSLLIRNSFIIEVEIVFAFRAACREECGGLIFKQLKIVIVVLQIC